MRFIESSHSFDSTRCRISSLCSVIGILWSFCLKWPFSIASIRYRRCVLSEATHVAVCVIRKEEENAVTFDSEYISKLRSFFAAFYQCVSFCMTLTFFDDKAFGAHRDTCNGVFEIRPVERSDDGSLFFIFRFRRYNLDGDKFSPGHFHVAETMNDILIANKNEGLQSKEVLSRRRIVGKNQIEIENPNFFAIFFREICKPFYTYQSFMIWSVSASSSKRNVLSSSHRFSTSGNPINTFVPLYSGFLFGITTWPSFG